MPEMKLSLGEILKEVVIAGAVVGIAEGLKDGAKKGAEEIGKKTTERIAKKFEEHRDELLTFLRGIKAENLLRRWRERQTCQKRSYDDRKPYIAGDEAHFQEALTKLYTNLSEPNEKNVRRQIFRWLDKMPDEEFDTILEILRYDNTIQWLERSWGWVQEVGKDTFNFLYSTKPESPGAYQKFNAFLEEKLGPATETTRTFRENRIKRRYR